MALRDLNGDPLVVELELPNRGGTDWFYAGRRLAGYTIRDFLRLRRRLRAEREDRIKAIIARGGPS